MRQGVTTTYVHDYDSARQLLRSDVGDFDVVVMDPPSSLQSPRWREGVMRQLAEASRNGSTRVVAYSHYPDLIQRHPVLHQYPSFRVADKELDTDRILEVLGLGGSDADPVDVAVDFLDGRLQLSVDAAIGKTLVGPNDHRYRLSAAIPFLPGALGPAVADLEQLITDAGVPESELQNFFAEYQEFITGFEYTAAIPQVRLSLDDGGTKILDFVLKPIGDSASMILEIKRPSAKIVIRRNSRYQLSADAQAGLTQLREYATVLSSESVQRRVAEHYGLDMFRPRLRLLIGQASGEVARQVRDLMRYVNEDITTYTEILSRARVHFL